MIQQSLFNFSAPVVPISSEPHQDVSHVENLLFSLPRSLVLLWEQRGNPDSPARKNAGRLELIVSDAFAHGLIDDKERAALDGCIRDAMPVPTPVLMTLGGAA
ncbi:hypothetical protein [Alcanivorax sp. DP30]|uniref:hypothetical protein n=1 Tax=Alcanivorax sp. DP30 TaxID=2606217 RepID=UPI00136E2A73|nr:hypothetical protein [Alcanivorax sp. DP30]MZR63836.1 hypothetical protein [Alcanivorax sp. DP30]